MASREVDVNADLPGGELATSGHILSGLDAGCFCLVFVGDVRLVWCVALERYCESMFAHAEVKTFYVDLHSATNLDSTTLGVLAKLAMLSQKTLNIRAQLSYSSPDLERLVKSMGFSAVFTIIEAGSAPVLNTSGLKKLCATDCSEDEVKRSVLDAHRVLSGMSEENRSKFKDLIENLEKN